MMRKTIVLLALGATAGLASPVVSLVARQGEYDFPLSAGLNSQDTKGLDLVVIRAVPLLL